MKKSSSFGLSKLREIVYPASEKMGENKATQFQNEGENKTHGSQKVVGNKETQMLKNALFYNGFLR